MSAGGRGPRRRRRWLRCPDTSVHDVPTLTPCPRQDSNLRTRLRRPALYPLSYGGERSPSLAVRPEATHPYARGVPTVLLVDDDPVILRLLEVNFRLEGFDTMTASRGPEALALAARQPDAIVLDLMLPEMDGHEVYRRLHEDPLVSAIRVVFLTARALDTTPMAPGVRYITKPFDAQALIETVRASIEGAGA